MRIHGPTLRLAASTGTVLLLGLLTACSTGSTSVEAAELEEHVTDNVTAEQDGVELTVDCPEDLEGEVDATASCTVDDGEGRTGVRFTTTEVDGEEVSFETIPFLEPATLEAALTDQLLGQGFNVSALECPEELDGVTDQTTECTATSQGEEGTLEVTVTEVDGLRVGFSWKVVD